MNLTQITEVVTPILKHRFQANGFHDTQVSSEEDFDGEIVLRVKARMKTPVAVMERVDATLEIKDALEQRGESRAVYLEVDTGESASETSDEEV